MNEGYGAIAPTPVTAVDKVQWQENDGAVPPGWLTHTIASNLDGPRTVFPADFDGDGDPDVVAASSLDDKITWYANLKPVISVDNVGIGEGGTASFTISATGTQTDTIDVTVQTSDGSAHAPGDYTALAPTVVHIPVNQTSIQVNVPTIQDTDVESAETFNLTLSSPANAAIGDGAGVATINDDDAAPPGVSTVTIDDPTVVEDGTAVFTMTASPAPTSPLTFTAASSDGTAASATDYTAHPSALVTIPAGSATANVSVPTSSDLIDELAETFHLDLSSPSSNAVLADAQGTATISDDDATPVISIDDASSQEGSQIIFTLTATNPSSRAMTVDFATADQTADGTDYTQFLPTQAQIVAGATTDMIAVDTTQDTVDEADEAFGVTISNPSNATIGDATETGTILDDDDPPSASIDDVMLKEGNKGHTKFAFHITLSAPSGQLVTIHYATTPGTAKADKDYIPLSDDLVIKAGQTSKEIDVFVVADTKKEGKKETFTLDLSDPSNVTLADLSGLGTIKNDDS